MTAWMTYALHAAVAGAATYVAGWKYPHALMPPVRHNNRGEPLPLSLGPAVTAGLVVVDLASLPLVLYRVATTGHGVPQGAWALDAAILLVFAAGTYDDRRPGRTRGVAAQLRPLLRGSVTPGAVKLGALLAAAATWGLVTGSSPFRLALAIPVIAGVANAWNLLDVTPGRACKYGLLAAVPLFVYRPTRLAARLGSVVAVALVPDVRERAMLGDAGANVIGFVMGGELFDRLGNRGLVGALAALVLIHVLSETVTLSRIIRAIPPLRWFDDLGRIRHPENEGSTSS